MSKKIKHLQIITTLLQPNTTEKNITPPPPIQQWTSTLSKLEQGSPGPPLERCLEDWVGRQGLPQPMGSVRTMWSLGLYASHFVMSCLSPYSLRWYQRKPCGESPQHSSNKAIPHLHYSITESHVRSSDKASMPLHLQQCQPKTCEEAKLLLSGNKEHLPLGTN